VALSRLRTFEGMVLTSPIPPAVLQTDATVLRFGDDIRQNPPSEARLQESKIHYQQQLLLDCFDLQTLQNRLNQLTRLLLNHAGVVRVLGVDDIHQVKKKFDEIIMNVSEKFKRQLRSIFPQNALPESDGYILERIAKASTWFQEQFALILQDVAHNMDVETDNQEVRKNIGDALRNLKQGIAVKVAGFQSCENGFSPTRYLRTLSDTDHPSSAEKAKHRPGIEYTQSDIEHTELLAHLKQWRSQKAEADGVEKFQIIHLRLLIQIAVMLPSSIADLRKIKGIGKKTAAKYGEELLEMVSAYRKKNGITQVSAPVSKKNPNNSAPVKSHVEPSDTQKTSFNLFNQGFTIAQIAQERGLV
jgi:hypothetical protein